MTVSKRTTKSKLIQVSIKWSVVLFSAISTWWGVKLYVSKYGVWPDKGILNIWEDLENWFAISPIAVLMLTIALKELLGWFIRKRNND